MTVSTELGLKEVCCWDCLEWPSRRARRRRKRCSCSGPHSFLISATLSRTSEIIIYSSSTRVKVLRQRIGIRLPPVKRQSCLLHSPRFIFGMRHFVVFVPDCCVSIPFQLCDAQSCDCNTGENLINPIPVLAQKTEFVGTFSDLVLSIWY